MLTIGQEQNFSFQSSPQSYGQTLGGFFDIQLREVSLLARLMTFGLDPKQWRLKAESSDTWLIESTRDSEVQLRGISTFRKAKWDWKQIELVT
jgi:hypothetical protein